MSNLAGIMQLLVAAAFVSIPVVRHRFGPAAKAAAVAELRRQRVRPEVLEENRLRFDAGGHETAAPAAVAAVMVAIAAPNFAGSDLARPLTWVFSSLVLLMNAAIVYSDLTAVRSVEAAFRRWVRAQTYLRNTVVFGGSAVALLAVSLG
ncbi:hypothetical protein [Streptomyces mayteni]